MIFISHKLHEVTAVSDRVTVLRAGRTIATVDDSRLDAGVARIADGRPRRRARSSRAKRNAAARPSCSRSTTSGPTATAAVRASTALSFTVRAGEIVAVAGVAGNGQRELAETIAGLRAPTKGVDSGRRQGACDAGDARAAYDAGVGYIPEDRLGTGVAPTLSIAMNLELRSYRRSPSGRSCAWARCASASRRDDPRTTTSRRRARRWRPTTSRAATSRSS